MGAYLYSPHTHIAERERGESIALNRMAENGLIDKGFFMPVMFVHVLCKLSAR